MYSAPSQRTVTGDVDKIADTLMEKLDQCNELFANLQEMTKKEKVEKYPSLFPEYCSLKQRRKVKQMSNRMAKQRRKNTPIRQNKAHLT